MNGKSWEWRAKNDEEEVMRTACDDDNTPKRNGWCWEGIHCTNPYCKFKHRNLPPVDSNPNSTLPSSIRGPRQHKATSNAVYNNQNLNMHVNNAFMKHGPDSNQLNLQGVQEIHEFNMHPYNANECNETEEFYSLNQV